MRDSDGSYATWNRLWGELPAERQVLFNPRMPSNLLELWQRCYFEDLWALMAERAADAAYCELGAGRATTSTYLAARGCRVTLVDRAPEALDLARANFAALGFAPPTTCLADARVTGLPSDSFDCVYNIGLLEHFEEPAPVVAETLRLLRSGGLAFLVIVPVGTPWVAVATRGLLNPLRLAVNVTRARWKGGHAPSSRPDMIRTNFDIEYWVRTATQTGAADVRCVPYNPYHSIYRTAALERFVTTRLYWLDFMRRRATGRAPWMRTNVRLSACQLLLFRKS